MAYHDSQETSIFRRRDQQWQIILPQQRFPLSKDIILFDTIALLRFLLLK